jgi:hypothetical protein
VGERARDARLHHRRTLGKRPNWWHVDERLPTLPDTLLFYFVTIVDAQAFVDRFSCPVRIEGDRPHGGTARTDERDTRRVGEMRKK